MKKILIILIITIQANAYLCYPPHYEPDCRTNGVHPFSVGTDAENWYVVQTMCKELGDSITSISYENTSASNCPYLANNSSVRRIRITSHIYIGVGTSSSLTSSSGYISQITDEERLESFKGGLYLVLLAFLVAAPIGLMVKLLRKSV